MHKHAGLIPTTQRHPRGEHRLTKAVLAHAVESIRAGSRRQAHADLRWVVDANVADSFAFERICAEHGYQPDVLRKSLFHLYRERFPQDPS